jgi:hypothetical protein
MAMIARIIRYIQEKEEHENQQKLLLDQSLKESQNESQLDLIKKMFDQT